jgi:hypothetical protein
MKSVSGAQFAESGRNIKLAACSDAVPRWSTSTPHPRTYVFMAHGNADLSLWMGSLAGPCLPLKRKQSHGARLWSGEWSHTDTRAARCVATSNCQRSHYSCVTWSFFSVLLSLSRKMTVHWFKRLFNREYGIGGTCSKYVKEEECIMGGTCSTNWGEEEWI